MGEYAKYNGQSIKIGTCENMYYLRYDQRELVTKEPHSLDPCDPEVIGEIRFRFPFPQEDDIQPGGFDDHNYGVFVPGGYSAPKTVDHYNVQFRASNDCGLLLSVPCPLGPDAHKIGATIHRNGFSGEVRVSQQRVIGDELWTVCECAACGAKWRCDYESAAEIAVAFRSEADRVTLEAERTGRPNDARAQFYHTMADRILAGYRETSLAPMPG